METANSAPSDLVLRSTAVWLGLFALAFANGAAREVVLKKALNVKEPWAHHLSALTAVSLFSAFVYGVWGSTHIQTSRQAWAVGAYWFGMTAFTEAVVLNRWIGGLSWRAILRTYNLAAGELWPLVLASVGLLPVAFQAWVSKSKAA